MIITRKLRLFLLLIFILFFAGIMMAGEAFAADWFNEDWSFRQEITINPDPVGNDLVPSQQNHFPVLIKITDQNNPIFGNALSNGDDILFTAFDGTSKLDHEIEYYKDTATKELDAWVRIPTLSTDTTIIYMYYGNSGAGNQENVTGTWNENGANNFKMVQHLEETPANEVTGHIDSTSNSNDSTPWNFGGTSSSTTDPENDDPSWDTNKKIDGADVFDGSNDYIDLPGIMSDYVGTGDNATIAVWMKPTGNPVTEDGTFKLPAVYRSGTGWMWITRGIYSGDDRIWVGYWQDGDGEHVVGITYTKDEWVHIALVVDDSDVLAYKNGSFVDSDTGGSGPDIWWQDAGWIGRGTTYFKGTIDEVRFSNTVRSADWIKTSYNNQNDPSSFLTFGLQAISIPTMTEWGMIIFMLFAGLVSIYYLRRRRTTP